MVTGSLFHFIAGFLINFVSTYLIVRLVYHPRGRGNTYVFTFLAFSTVIYFIMGLFTSIELSIGTGFGLFALFSMLRYRTETVPIREMTYLFVMAAMPILNGVFWDLGSYGHLAAVDALILLVMWALERAWGYKPGQYQMEIRYEKIDLVKHDRRDEMLRDLAERTGLVVHDYEIVKINFLRDGADIRVMYYLPGEKQGGEAETPSRP
jgi:hypothetical protein